MSTNNPFLGAAKGPGNPLVQAISTRQVSGALAQAEAEHLDRAVGELNQRLMRLEQFVLALPWKSEARVNDQSGNTLALERHNGEWILCWTESNPGAALGVLLATFMAPSPLQKQLASPSTKKILLRDASLEVKSRACQMLGALIDKVQEQARERARTVQSAHAALDEIERRLLNASVVTEGK